MVTLDTALFLVGLIMEAALLSLLLYRRIYKSLPVFSSYIAWSIINDVGAFLLIRHFPDSDLRIYLINASVDAILMFCILIEISMSVLKPIQNSLDRWTGLKVAVLVLCLCGVVWLFTKPSAYAGVPLKQLIVHMQLTTSIVRVLFFIGLAALSQVLSLGWRDRELQLATGFGIYSFASLLVELVHQNHALWSTPTVHQFHVLEQIASTSYLLSVMYWTVSFVQAEAERREFTPQMHNFLLAVAGNARSARVAMTAPSKPGRHMHR